MRSVTATSIGSRGRLSVSDYESEIEDLRDQLAWANSVEEKILTRTLESLEFLKSVEDELMELRKFKQEAEARDAISAADIEFEDTGISMAKAFDLFVDAHPSVEIEDVTPEAVAEFLKVYGI
jgi:antirestriction protein